MIQSLSNFSKYLGTTVLAILLLTGPALADDVYPFRVVFEDTPGTEHLIVGDLDRGIRVLEQVLESGTANEGFVLATLCGAYILAQDLENADTTCAAAVQRFPGESAYNNRGVLRAFSGDIVGATRDFDRARPTDMANYMEALKKRDVGLVSNGNHDLIRQLAANHSSDDVGYSFAAREGAEIETIVSQD